MAHYCDFEIDSGTIVIERKIDMKKYFLTMLSIFMLALTACSDTATPSEKATIEKESTLTAEEVYEKSMRQLDTLESAAFNLSMEQTMDFGEEEQMTTKADVTGELMEEPFMMHQNGRITMESAAVGTMEINIEMYAQDEVVYVYENMFNNWIKGTMDDLADIGLEIGEEQSPFSHVEELDQYIEEFTFDQTDDTFIFKLETNSDEFHQLIMDELQEFQLDLDESKDVMGMIDIDQLHYAFIIDKETFNMLSFTIDFSINITEDDNTIAVESSIEADFSDFNEIDEITIPQEVLDEAVDQSEAFGF